MPPVNLRQNHNKRQRKLTGGPARTYIPLVLASALTHPCLAQLQATSIRGWGLAASDLSRTQG